MRLVICRGRIVKPVIRSEGKTWHNSPEGKVTPKHVTEHDHPTEGKKETDETGYLQGENRETGHHVNRMYDQLTECVICYSNLPRIEPHWNGAKIRRAPGEE